jgi:hypothetical protein
MQVLSSHVKLCREKAMDDPKQCSHLSQLPRLPLEDELVKLRKTGSLSFSRKMTAIWSSFASAPKVSLARRRCAISVIAKNWPTTAFVLDG